MIWIHCIEDTGAAENNYRLAKIELWLNDNVGKRWQDWDWSRVYGFVGIKDSELATVFKLKFGV